MKRLSKEDRETLIGLLLDYDFASVKNDTSSVISIFRSGCPGYENMLDCMLIEIAVESNEIDLAEEGITVLEDKTPEKQYLVQWEIDEYAASPEEAALLARYHQRPDGTANVFTVIDKEGNRTKIDLMEDAGQENSHGEK